METGAPQFLPYLTRLEVWGSAVHDDSGPGRGLGLGEMESFQLWSTVGTF